MANIIPLKDNTRAQFYPQTHEKAVVDSNGVNLQTKLASIVTPTYVTAWDGSSTPVVANIPAGVSVTYNTTTYTGTLAASASTANKTYLVSTGTTDNYNRYVTQLNGSTYSWQILGSTEIDLSDYATKAELSQLSQEVDRGLGKKVVTTLPITWELLLTQAALNDSGKFTAGYPSCTKAIPVAGGSTVNFTYVPKVISGNTVNYSVRVAFYSSPDINDVVSVGQKTYAQIDSISVPAAAKYMRISLNLGNIYVRQNFDDGDITLSFVNNTIGADVPSVIKDLEKNYHDLSRIIYADEVISGRVWTYSAANGIYTAGNAYGSYIVNPLLVRGGTVFVLQLPEVANYLPAYSLVFADANGDYISTAQFNTWDRVEIPQTARYAYLSVAYYSKTNKALTRLAFTDNLYCNALPIGIYEDNSGIVSLNGERHLGNIFRQAKKAGKRGTTVQTTPLTLLHFSDIHGSVGNMKRIVELKEKYSSFIDDVINTGDTMASNLDDSYADNIVAVAGADTILTVIGNHDVINSSSTAVAATVVYNKLIGPNVAKWGVVQPADAAANGYCYFYKDYPTQKIRLIVYDCMHSDTTQVNWLTEVLADARSKEYAVIIGVHYPAGVLDQKDTSFSSVDYELIKNSTTIINTSVVNAVQDYIDAGGEFIAWLCGHEHRDAFGTVVGKSKQLCIVIDTANGTSTQQFSRAAAYGEKSYDCINLVSIDPSYKLLKIVRIGADYDRNLRHVDSACWNYQDAILMKFPID